jgi:hypothetical protein
MAMNNFDKNWRSASISVFRLEAKPEYKVPGEADLIAKWKKGEPDLGANAEWQKWVGSLKKAKAKKLQVKRVRVVPKTFTDYIRFEVALWQKYSAKNGEQIFFIGADAYKTIINECGFNSKDFWLFDDTTLLIMNYGTAGQFIGEILIADNGMVNRYRQLKDKLFKAAVPMEAYLKKIS